MNIEKSMKHNPSKCDELSSNSPKSGGSHTPTGSSSKYTKSTLAKKWVGNREWKRIKKTDINKL